MSLHMTCFVQSSLAYGARLKLDVLGGSGGGPRVYAKPNLLFVFENPHIVQVYG